MTRSHLGRVLRSGIVAAGEPKVIQQVEAGGRFRIVRLLGRGGMGAVYLARQAALERDVALKVIDVEPGALAEQAALRFEQEMRATARVEHPNTVRLYDSGALDGGFYLAMEYLPGRTLRAVIEGGAPLPPGRAARIALADLRARSAAAHAAGIVHRDLKPENVMLVRARRRRPTSSRCSTSASPSFVDTQGEAADA